jgi:hypothetical protein
MKPSRQSQRRHSVHKKWRALAILLVAGAATGCAKTRAPAELDGLWSRSLAACAAGLGVTFRADAVRARFGADTFVLLADPHYEVRDSGASAMVRIDYRLPSAPGGVNAALGRGVIQLERTAAGRLAPHGAWFVDLQTGSARAALAPGPLSSALDLGLCPSAAVLKQTAEADLPT